MARPTTTTGWRRPSRTVVALFAALLAVLAAGAVALATFGGSTTSPPSHQLTAVPPETTTSAAASTAPGAPTTARATDSTTTSVPPSLAPPGPGFVAGQVTAIGDSVMLDYQDPLEAAIPGISVDAAVSRQWSDGEVLLQTLKGEGQLGADVIVGLGTNGPITDTDFDNMMAILSGASRVVFVNVHVDRPWQDSNNAVIASGAARVPQRRGGGLGHAGGTEPTVVRGGRHAPGHRWSRGRRAGRLGDVDARQRMNPGVRAAGNTSGTSCSPCPSRPAQFSTTGYSSDRPNQGRVDAVATARVRLRY